MSRLLTSLKRAVKWALRPLADALLASSRSLPAHLEEHLAASPTLPRRVEECLASRVEESVRQSDVLAQRVEECLATSETLTGRVEDCLAASETLSQRVEECLLSSEAVAGRIEECLAGSESLTSRVEEQVAGSASLPELIDGVLAASAALTTRVEECLATSEVVPGRVDEWLTNSEALVGRVEECLTTSTVLPERVEVCVRELRALADRIEECLWSSKALPRRIDEHLAGSKALPDILLEECLRRSNVLPQVLTDLLPDHPGLAAVVVPYQEDYPACVPRIALGPNLERTPASLPLPDEELWEGYGPDAAAYLASGREHVGTLRDLLAAAGTPAESAGRILDLTCGAGRALRWLADLASSREIWGSDVSAPHVAWLQQHLCPPFRAMTRSTYPHLPFEDRSFDLIYSLTPFGQPPELADAWLLELRRVLRPGGKLCLCVLDKQAVERLLDPARSAAGDEAVLRGALQAGRFQELLRSDYALLAVPTPLGVRVLYDLDHLRKHWGWDMRFVSVTPGACGPYTALLWERP